MYNNDIPRGQMLTTIDHTHPRIAAAITFVENEIRTALTHAPPGTHLHSTFTPRAWVHYIPALDVNDERERTGLIQKYGQATPDELAYYIYYHGCYEFVVFYWTVLSVARKTPVIAEQKSPFRHCYIMVDGNVVDPLLQYANVTYPYGMVSPTLHATPHGLFAECYKSETGLRDWEQEDLDALKRLE
jgi:hypothetical protein